jgi:sigma-B regulation protein RsbU (phosphoserine phosphatase)
LLTVIITIAMLALVTVLDYLALPQLDMSVGYFVPIVFAAWKLGRVGAFSVGIIAEIQAVLDHLRLTPHAGHLVAIANTVVRLMIYLFVAEVTTRLINITTRVRQTLDELRNSNKMLLQAYERLEEDIEAAGIVQAEVLEVHIPEVSGCEVGVCVKYARQVGGDFVDVGLIDDRVYACVADVSGKGVPAALFTTLLKHLLLEAHARGQHTEEVIATLSLSLSRVLPPEYFVTIFYGELEPSSGRLEYVNAGHPPGLVYRRDTGSIEFVSGNMPLLGYWTSDKGIGVSVIQLEKSDVLTLYTDGAVDSRRPDGSRLGGGFIRSMIREYADLSAQDMASMICERIIEATAEGGRDDIAILCLRMTGL